jgi:broad specificity phosphatase PhoE
VVSAGGTRADDGGLRQIALVRRFLPEQSNTVIQIWRSLLLDLPAWLQALRISVTTARRLRAWQRHLRLLSRQPDFPDLLQREKLSMKKQTLLFVRHGQTSWNVEHRLPGRLPGVLLNETGREQVARLADALAVLPISAIISSPLERARDTAAILAQSRHLDVWLEPDLVDTDLGHWAGERYDELQKKDPAWQAFVRNPTVAPSADVETFTQVQQRSLAAVERWRLRPESGSWPLFVSHADVIRLLVAHYCGLPPAKTPWLLLDNASVSIVELLENEPPRTIAIGWTPRPGWLRPPLPSDAAETALAPAPSSPAAQSSDAPALASGDAKPGERSQGNSTIEGEA